MFERLQKITEDNKTIIISFFCVCLVVLALGLGLGLGLQNNSSGSGSGSGIALLKQGPLQLLNQKAEHLESSGLNNLRKIPMYNLPMANDKIANTRICFNMMKNFDSLVTLDDRLVNYVKNMFKVSDDCVLNYDISGGSYENNPACGTNYLAKIITDPKIGFGGIGVPVSTGSRDYKFFSIYTPLVSKDKIVDKTFLDIGNYVNSIYNNENYATWFLYDLVKPETYIIVIYVFDINLITDKTYYEPRREESGRNINNIVCSSEKNLKILDDICSN